MKKQGNIFVTQDQNSKIIFINQSRMHLKLKCSDIPSIVIIRTRFKSQIAKLNFQS